MKLNLGCGKKKLNGYVNIDIQYRVQPDLVVDISKGLPFANNSTQEVTAFDFLEHVERDDVIFVMNEIHRVLVSNGLLRIRVPSTDGRGAFQDPTHRSYWNENSFKYYMNDSYRDLYGIQAKFKGTVTNIKKSNNIVVTKAELIAIK